jgi:thioredoxin 1
MSNMIFLGFFKKKNNNNSNQKTSSKVEWPEYIVNLNEKTFDDFIQKYPLSIIDFWASWCAPCKAMAPRLRKLSKIYKGKVAFGKLDVQENRDISKKYKISGIPHLICFKYGKKISSITGLKSVYDLKNTIEDILKR